MVPRVDLMPWCTSTLTTDEDTKLNDAVQMRESKNWIATTALVPG
jgi:hypothetical protein